MIDYHKKRQVSGMDMNTENNSVMLCGTVAGAPTYSHSSRGQDFYSFPLEVMRLSGNSDTVNIIVRREQLDALEADGFEKLRVTGQVRSFNNRRGEGARLVITVLAKELTPCFDDDENTVSLRGTLCKAPNLRSTPMGRDICDMMVAVNRRYGRSDYLPCICWGIKAREAAEWGVGTHINVVGRLQSRTYVKMTDDGPIEKTAFEISASDVAEAVEPINIM